MRFAAVSPTLFDGVHDEFVDAVAGDGDIVRAVRGAVIGVHEVSVAVDVFDLRQEALFQGFVECADPFVPGLVVCLLRLRGLLEVAGGADIHDIDFRSAGDPRHSHEVVVGDVLLHDRGRCVACVVVAHPEDDLRLVVDGVEAVHLEAGDQSGREVRERGAPLEVPEDAAVLLQEVVDELPVVADLAKVRGTGVSDDDGLFLRALDLGRDRSGFDRFGLVFGEGRNGQTPAEDHGHEDRDQGSFSRFHAVSFPSGGARKMLSFSASILLDYV